MPRCFVTGCKSGYDSQRSAEKRHFFRAPRDSSRLQVWQRAIPRLDKQLTSSCVVCDLHFEDSDLVKEFVHNINGDIVIIPRDNWALKDDAKPARKRKQPAVRRAPPVKVRKRQGDVTSLCDDGSNCPVCGAIASLYSELVDLAKTNQKIQGWSLEVVDASVVVYKLKMETAVPRVDKAVVVSRTLTVSMCTSAVMRRAMRGYGLVKVTYSPSLRRGGGDRVAIGGTSGHHWAGASFPEKIDRWCEQHGAAADQEEEADRVRESRVRVRCHVAPSRAVNLEAWRDVGGTKDVA
ncbi:hypothetical protein HPB49_009788 [Dermacentor silvarum]|uniref:Uncharacterized protein n=1 Tax=Dermacentor silvarum TaxID=543639 RepID=A0ACB8DYV8_DERSI|nr:hypothetical protein HPB49_009788 [Dermacentor silvarum]